jgi:hypothetical protein
MTLSLSLSLSLWVCRRVSQGAVMPFLLSQRKTRDNPDRGTRVPVVNSHQEKTCEKFIPYWYEMTREKMVCDHTTHVNEDRHAQRQPFSADLAQELGQ